MTSQTLHVFSDGGARGNPGPAAIGVLICSADGSFIDEHSEVIGETTNNVAEYTAVIRGLELAKGLGEEIHYFVDSELVANQLLGKYRIKTPHIRDLFLKVLERLKPYKKVTFKHVPRTHEKIRHVDKLVNLALNKAGY